MIAIKENSMLTGLIVVSIAFAASLVFNGVQIGVHRNEAKTLEAATANTNAALAPLRAEQEKLAAFMDAERLDPFCKSGTDSFDLLMCSYKECVNRQAAQGQVASKECGDLSKRILDRDEWKLCSAVADKDERGRCFELL